MHARCQTWRERVQAVQAYELLGAVKGIAPDFEKAADSRGEKPAFCYFGSGKS